MNSKCFRRRSVRHSNKFFNKSWSMGCSIPNIIHSSIGVNPQLLHGAYLSALTIQRNDLRNILSYNLCQIHSDRKKCLPFNVPLELSWLKSASQDWICSMTASPGQCLLARVACPRSAAKKLPIPHRSAALWPLRADLTDSSMSNTFAPNSVASIKRKRRRTASV